MSRRWADDNPFFLLIVADDRAKHVKIDLGKKGWSKTHARWMRRPGWWYLCDKVTGQVRIAMIVANGEQPYYAKRHVGQMEIGGTGRFRQTACYGIGKKRLDGHVDRVWLLPDLVTVCGGEDVEPLAMEVVKTLEWQEQPPA